MRQVIKIKNFVFDEVDEADFTKRKIKKIKRIASIQGLGNLVEELSFWEINIFEITFLIENDDFGSYLAKL